MGKKLLILGAQGLIGRACHKHFSEQHIFDLLVPTRAELDISSRSKTRAYFKTHSIDYVILAAGLVGGLKFNSTYPADFITKNLKIELNVFEAAQEVGVHRVIFFGSSCMYPKICSQPMREEHLMTGALEPTSLSYALAKLCGIQMAKGYNRQYQTNRFAVLIPNTAFGPHGNFDPERGHVMGVLIARFHRAKQENAPSITLWGTGEARREFIFVDDIARGVDTIFSHPNIPVPINLGAGEDISIKALATCIAEVIDYRGKIEWDTTKPTGTLRKLLDNTKIKALGWEPQVDLKTGIEITYQWYLKQTQKTQVSV